jgi:hypothetical protein
MFFSLAMKDARLSHANKQRRAMLYHIDTHTHMHTAAEEDSKRCPNGNSINA